MTEICTVFNARSGIKVTLHPLAIPAYDWLTILPKLIDWNTLPASFTASLLSEPLRGVMHYESTEKNRKIRHKPTKFSLYAPLWPALYWPANHPPDSTILIHNSATNQPDDQDIERAAWLSVLSLMMFSVDRRSIAELRDSLQTQLPEHLSRTLFNKKKISDADLCRWTGLTRGTLIQQRQRGKSTTTTVTTIDPLEALAQPWSQKHE
ncbi:hypothetical protein [Shewanella sp. TB7-MNA-CIBAN-0143]|uniref:hypothetical protein n=1 Tax=Shewanella sp. TB7-MNA-CIBAN-0143 TaxID=3140465 RepID=UPI00332B486B